MFGHLLWYTFRLRSSRFRLTLLFQVRIHSETQNPYTSVEYLRQRIGPLQSLQLHNATYHIRKWASISRRDLFPNFGAVDNTRCTATVIVFVGFCCCIVPYIRSKM
jgi:hypothetical protein